MTLIVLGLASRSIRLDLQYAQNFALSDFPAALKHVDWYRAVLGHGAGSPLCVGEGPLTGPSPRQSRSPHHLHPHSLGWTPLFSYNET